MSQKDPIFAYLSSAACGSIKMNVFCKNFRKNIYVAFPRLVGRGGGEKAKTKGGPRTEASNFLNV
jgi:hypothetical protein